MSLPFNPEKGLILIPTKLWGPNGDTILQLALDTGATSCIVNWDILILLGYDPAIISKRIKMTTGSGIEFVPQIAIEEIEALGLKRWNFSVLCHTLPPSATVDGVLGLDFFRGHKIIVDLRNGFVSIE